MYDSVMSKDSLGRRRHESKEIIERLQKLEGTLPERLRELVRLNHSMIELLALRYLERAIGEAETTLEAEVLRDVKARIEDDREDEGDD